MHKETNDITSQGIQSARESYDLYAKFYDSSTDWFTHDLAFYQNLLSSMKPPFLEIGCGTGRVLKYLLDAKNEETNGHYLTGIDISDAMLKICEEKTRIKIADGSLRLINHDLTTSSIQGETFNAALVTFYTMNYIAPDLQSVFLDNIRGMIGKSGLIVINLFYPPIRKTPENSGFWTPHEPLIINGKTVTFQEKQEMISDDTEERSWVFTVKGQDPEAISTKRFYISPKRGKTLLEAAGFIDVAHLVNYDTADTGVFEEDPNAYGFTLIARNSQ